MGYKGSVAIISGASKGIGAAIAVELAKKGLNVIINYNASEEQAMKLSETIKKEQGKCEIKKFDVSNFAEVEAAFAEVVDKYKTIDYLVNNAGIVSDNLIIKMKEEEFDRVIKTNLYGVFNCSKIAAKYMIKQKFGVIVNISSIIGIFGNAGQSNYAASKAGIIGFTKSLAKELGSRNIRVNAVAPGFIETDMTESLNIIQKKLLTDKISLKRLGSGEDIANVVAFLLSEESSYITGEVINVSGGLTI
ncbi:MAG: 3-oxoacyl-[acyl-carrier-protein] reductase [Desulfurella sp.]|jgi:3-oxoacyl-[acyl-carrier protein] reductase|uniref:3-oxoacyl-[acyl-carrier-protein] reductase n=2 Tax=Desulfurella multipotens TaxID=79269 RepID=A0A1G6JYL3_9BACT|nr:MULTISPECIES: 3-oxoacyl-[acyl-carrier-protein] reductase [Desulfurella]PMP91665.1 MAG: 3-oxoacyl-[acyl-carrier-protein] reductase [Desulfurella sp.]SDC23116.1 3-oxoacyl-[acyl-carrier-protein] reductase [Desulfurella multipotens]HEX13705.1 3-oxoacyl-[acyl-carrier-protein] reductase [Desulfurella acetivorans]